MSNQTQNLNQDLEQNQNNKKPFLSTSAKTILALIVFTALTAVIISGVYFLTKHYKTRNKNEIVNQKGNEFYCEINSDCIPTTLECGPCPDNTIAINKNYLEKYQEKYWDKCRSKGYRTCFSVPSGISKCINNKCELLFDFEEENCAKSGESANPEELKGKAKYFDNCCSGLKKLKAYNINDNGECEEIIGNPFPTCMPCGNGVCESIDGFKENKCNCLEDCGEEKIPIQPIIPFRGVVLPPRDDWSVYEQKFYCEKDGDCAVYFSHCDCQYHCANKNIEIEDCAVDCDETGPIISECVCENNKCVDKKFLECDEKKVILEGKLNIIHSKYPINVIETSENTYWMYETPKNFEKNLNKNVRMEAIISPANGKCNICYRRCPNCQCPTGQELLYNTKILEVLE